MKAQNEEIVGTEKEFMDVFKTLCYSRSAWEVWSDLMTVMACSLSNATDRTPEHYEKREKEYQICINKLGSVEVVSKLFAIITMAFERDPEQDFLGKLYMTLELGNHWKGQFFTPYSVCQCMAEISTGYGMEEQIKRIGYISVNDPACGAGATLVATANTLRKREINYQRDVLFVGQDIDRVVGMMCYIQLSLLGCPGYVVIANTLTNPVCGSVLRPIKKEGQEFWYTPFFSRTEWCGRRLAEALGLSKLLFSKQENEEKQEINIKREEFFIFFEFNKEEEEMSDNAKTLQFTNGSEKLRYEEEEMLKSVAPEYKEVMKKQFDNVFEELTKKSDEDTEFNNKVLLMHKSFKRCMKYASEKAMGMRNPSDAEKNAARKGTPIVTPVTSDILFGWIYEYYDLDDKDAVEKENAKKTEAPAKSVKQTVQKNVAAKETKKVDSAAKMQQKEPKSPKKSELDGQLSLMDLFK